MKNIRSFTLIELIIIVIILGILVTFAAPQYSTTKEKSLEKEAFANLQLIIAAEKIYLMEHEQYYATPGNATTAIARIQAINEGLKLSIPYSNSRNWNYRLSINNSASPKTACADATRINNASIIFHLRNTEDLPTTGGCS